MPPDASAPPRPADASVVVCCFTTDRLDDTVAAVSGARREGAGEVVVVVDHNDELLTTLSAMLPPAVVLVPNRERQGLSGGRNTAVAVAKGDVVVFLDDDARPEPGWLAALLAPYGDPSVAGTGGAAVPLWPEQGRPAWLPDEFLWVVGCSYRGQPSERADVRNFIGANMSFRREVFDRVGGFEHGLGRVGSTPLGCEESEFCIRLRQQVPRARLVLDPDARVLHRVTAQRCTWLYFRRRCWSEGLSKAMVSRLVGAGDGLSSERGYATRVLPAAVLRGVSDALRGDADGLRRVAAVVAGLVVTTSGYLRGRVALRHAG